MKSSVFVLCEPSFPPALPSPQTYRGIYVSLQCSKRRRLHFPIQSLINPSVHSYRPSAHNVPKVLSKNNKHLTKTPTLTHKGPERAAVAREKEKRCRRGQKRTNQDRLRTGQKTGERRQGAYEQELGSGCKFPTF